MVDINGTVEIINTSASWINEVASVSQIIIALSTTAGVVGVWFAYKSLKATHDWNRRHLAIEKILDIQTSLKEYRNNVFEKHLHYSSRNVAEPYKIKELHKLMCEIKDDKLIWNDDKHCVLTKEGRELSNQIATFLDTYEIVAGAVIENTFDEQIVKNLLGGSMKKAHKLFCEYIIHLREHYKRPLIYKNLEKIVKKWEAEETDVVKREATG